MSVRFAIGSLSAPSSVLLNLIRSLSRLVSQMAFPLFLPGTGRTLITDQQASTISEKGILWVSALASRDFGSK